MTSRHFSEQDSFGGKREAKCGNQKVNFALAITPSYKKLVFFATFTIGRYFQLILIGKMILFLLNGGFSRILAFLLLIYIYKKSMCVMITRASRKN